MPKGQEEKVRGLGGVWGHEEGVFREITGCAEAFRDGWVMGVGGGRDRIVAVGRG